MQVVKMDRSMEMSLKYASRDNVMDFVPRVIKEKYLKLRDLDAERYS